MSKRNRNLKFMGRGVCLGWCWLLEQGVAHRGGASRSLLNESEDLEYHRDFMFLNKFVELRGVQEDEEREVGLLFRVVLAPRRGSRPWFLY